MTPEERKAKARKYQREYARGRRAKDPLRNIYAPRASAARKKGLPISPYEEWRDALPPRPEDTDLWAWAIKAIDPAKGLLAGNFRWEKRLKPGALSNKLGDFNIGIENKSRGSKKTRLVRIAKDEGRETLDDLGHSYKALVRQHRADIDHEANVGRFFGYSLRVVGVEYRQTSRPAPIAYYLLRCSVCGQVTARQACRVLGTKKHAPADTCPHCQGTAKRAQASSRSMTYYEFKQMLKNIVVQEEVVKESTSHFGLRNRNMDFCEMCIDADLTGHGETLREIYAI